MRPVSERSSAAFGAGGHRFGARNAPHIFFCLGKRKRAAPGTKENRLFSGLLVRPVKTGLVSSSCAEPLALPVRSRRNCKFSADLRVQRGPVVPLAPLPLGRAFVASFFPAGAKALFFYPLSGSGAVAQSSPICTNRLFETGQLRRKRHGSAGRGAQPETARQVIAQCSHRAASFFFSSTGRGAFSFFKKRMGGAFPAPNRCIPAPVLALVLSKKERIPPRRKRRNLPAPARSAGDLRAAPEHPGSGIGRTQMPAPEHPAQLPAAWPWHRCFGKNAYSPHRPPARS